MFKPAIFVVWMFIFSFNCFAQQQSLPKTSAGFPINFNEDAVGTYILPDMLRLDNGQMVSGEKEWTEKRRPEILRMIEQIQFGKSPGRPAQLNWQVVEQGSAFRGKAIRKQVVLYFTKGNYSNPVNMLVYLPSASIKPVPLLLNLSFSANNQLANDSAVRIGYTWTKDGRKLKADSASRFSKLNIEQFIDAGFGFATIYYGDIEPDFKQGYKVGVRSLYKDSSQYNWAAISAWAWGLSRAMDYFEKDKDVNSRRIALQGASRLGKAVLWAGARDTRFKMVLASISGEGGAALSKRNYGENMLHITDTSRYYYWFTPEYHAYATHSQDLPFDAHMLLALMAPRPLLLQTGDSDYWSDPYGEFLSAKEASRVYALFGKSSLLHKEYPRAGSTSLLMNELGYYMHQGGHTVLPEDWTLFITYMKKYL